MSRIGPNLFTILRHEFSSHDHHPTFHSRETSTLLLSSTLPLIARFLFLYIYIYRRSSNEATTRRGGRSPPSPPFQLSFRGIESPPNRFPARENCGRNIGNFEICSLPQSFWFIHRENVFERTGGRECDRIGFWTFDIVSRINKIRRYARVFVDFYEFLTKHQITVSVLKLLFFQTVIFTMIFKYVLRCYLSNILI